MLEIPSKNIVCVSCDVQVNHYRDFAANLFKSLLPTPVSGQSFDETLASASESVYRQLLTEARRVYALYIEPGVATYEINISASILVPIQDVLLPSRYKLVTIHWSLVNGDFPTVLFSSACLVFVSLFQSYQQF